MKNLTDEQLIKNYKTNYHLANDLLVTKEMIYFHWELEKHLTETLLISTPENRWEVFERCYTSLYSQVPWLNGIQIKESEPDPQIKYRYWRDLLGHTPINIFEIGSGKGSLLSYLSTLGHNCTATEISKERGEKFNSSKFNLKWLTTDGVNLTNFTGNLRYQVVISNQVIEHLHPDDLLTHFNNVSTILTSGGSYIFTTPNSYFGPSDISKVFNFRSPQGMHLKEYTMRELKKILKSSGFKKCYSFSPTLYKFRLPSFIYKSAWLFQYQSALEFLLFHISNYDLRKKMAFLFRYLFLNSNHFIIAYKK